MKRKLKSLVEMGPEFAAWRKRVNELEEARLFGGKTGNPQPYDRVWERNLRAWWLSGLTPEQVAVFDKPTPAKSEAVYSSL